jgi:hypothetical protein
MKIETKMNTKTYKNRYGDEYRFTPTDDGHILWEGSFEYHRTGYPNVYDDAYNQYRKDGGELSSPEFVKEIHRQEYNEAGDWLRMSDIGTKYHELVYSDRDTIDMVDPSGGPYLTRGTASESIHEAVVGKKVDQFILIPNKGYKIILR